MPVEIVLVAMEDRREISRLPALLRRAGANVTLLGNLHVTMAWSRFVNRKIACGPEPMGLSLALRALISQSEGSPWLMCCDDAALAAIAHSRAEDWLERMFPVDPRGGMVDAIFKKSAFANVAAEVLPIAPSTNCTSAQDAANFAEKIGFPVVLRRDVDRGGINRIVVKKASKIAAAYSSLADGGFVVVQKLIEGQSGTSDILFHRGGLVCWSSWFDGRAVRAIDPQLDEILSQVGKLTGFQGFAGVDWVRDRDNKFHVTRFHGMPTAGLQWGRYNGVDFFRALWELFHGMLRVQKPREVGSPGAFSKFARIPWNDPGLLLRSILG